MGRNFQIYIYIFLKKVHVILPPAGHLPGRSHGSHSTRWSEKLFQERETSRQGITNLTVQFPIEVETILRQIFYFVKIALFFFFLT